MQNNIVKRFDATACTWWRCFGCNLRMENMISFGEATFLWSVQSVWIHRGNTVTEISKETLSLQPFTAPNSLWVYCTRGWGWFLSSLAGVCWANGIWQLRDWISDHGDSILTKFNNYRSYGVYQQTGLLFSKLNEMFFGYFDPEKILKKNENK